LWHTTQLVMYTIRPRSTASGGFELQAQKTSAIRQRTGAPRTTRRDPPFGGLRDFRRRCIRFSWLGSISHVRRRGALLRESALSKFAAALQRALERGRIAVFKVAAGGKSAGKPRRLYSQRLQRACKVQRRRLALDRGIGRDNHFADGCRRADARDEFVHLDVFGSDAVERRKRPVQDVIDAVEAARPLHRHQVRRSLDHADYFAVARRVLAHVASRIIRQPETFRAQ